MAIFSGPEIPNNGLVFHYDMGNTVKSWKGAPTTNVYPNPVVENGVSNFSLVSSSEIAPDNTPTARSWTCPNIGSQSQFWSPYITSTSMFTYSVWLKASSPVTVRLYPQGTYESERVEVTVTTSWQRFSVSRTASASVTVGGLVRIFGGSAFSGTLYIWGHQLEANSFATPYINGTRSNTQAIIDLTGNNTVTASSLTYASDGTFSFNGSSNLLVFPENSIMNTNSPTVEVWIKTSALSQNGFWFEKGTVNSSYSLFQEGSNIVWRTVNSGSPPYNNLFATASYLSTSAWAHIVGTYTTGSKRLYINGVQVANNTASGTIATNANGCSIGVYGGFNGSRSYWYNGSIGNVKVYNRALLAAEIQQNFEAARGRYGI